MIVIPLLGMVLYSLGCLIVAYLGRFGKFGFWGNFFASLILTPLVGLVIMLAQNLEPKKDAGKPD